jgi:hypothetical protein
MARTAACAVVLLLCSIAWARGASPWLPIALDPAVERDVERVLVLAGVPTLTRPIAAATVLDALPEACRVDPATCRRVAEFLERYKAPASITHAGFEAGYANGSEHPVPNHRGLGLNGEWDIAARAQWRPFDHAIIAAGVLAHEGDVTPTGSVVSVGWSKFQLDLGWREHWLSPFTDSAMLLSTQAESMPSVTLSNYEPISRLGIRYAVFAARMSRSDEILEDGGVTRGHPRLAGMQLSIEPVPGWSLGASRILQFGGGSRDSSIGGFLKAFFDPAGRDNVRPGGALTEQFGNQLASITSRFVFPGPVPFGAYVEFGGEDTLSRENYLLGNASLSLGLDFPLIFDRFDFTYEASEWQNAWYVHPLYGDGLANRGRVLGHWGGDQRRKGDGVGAQTHMLRVGWRPSAGGRLELRYRTLRNESYSVVRYERAHDFALTFMRPWRKLLLGGEVNVGRDADGEHFTRLVASVRYAPESPGGSPVPGSDSTREADVSAPGAEIFVDVGASLSRVRIDLDRTIPVRTTTWSPAPHFAIGARRAVSDHQDLGVRLEAMEIDSDWMIGVRLVDYRLRFGDHIALSGFLGAARWALATPAYGMYVGAGVQWRDIWSGWHIGFDARYSPNIARDDLVPSDPIGGRVSSYRETVIFSLYLSRGL